MIDFHQFGNEIKQILGRKRPFPWQALTTMNIPLWPLVIELGDFKISSATPLNELGWFLLGLFLLTGSSAAVLWWRRRARPDPFI